MDYLKALCRIADYHPLGIHEGHPILDDLTLFTLKNKNLIRPSKMTTTGMVYELTADGWHESYTSCKKYDN